MKRLFLLLSFFLSCFLASAQPDLYFVNARQSKIIKATPGHTLSISYRGYLGQKEYVKAQLTDVNDSMITLGADPAMFPGFMRNSMENNPAYVYRKIYLKDILSFRRMKPTRQLLKSSLIFGTILGSFYLFRELNQNSNFNSTELFWISLGTGIGTSYLINAFFPEAPKFRIADGWVMVVSLDKPRLP